MTASARSQGRRYSVGRRTLLGFCLAIAVGAAAGCSSPVEEPPGLDSDAVYAEYVVERDTLTLPSGVQWPSPVFPTDTIYGPGSGTVRADVDWICAWAGAYVNSSDSARADALAQLDGIKDLPVYVSFSDHNYKTVVGDMLDKAHLGDPSMISQYYQLNCP